jgi:hypothetical protein
MAISLEGGAVDLAALDHGWNLHWPGVRPVGRDLKRQNAALWTRLHTLPDGQRYPTDDAQLSEILRRHHAVLAMLVASRVIPDDDTLTVITCSWSDSWVPTPRYSTLVQAMPAALHWRSDDLATEPGFHAWQHTFVSRTTLDDPALDNLLTMVALDQTDDVILADRTLKWLYHPYDGGGDLIAPDELRSLVATRCPDWLA